MIKSSSIYPISLPNISISSHQKLGNYSCRQWEFIVVAHQLKDVTFKLP
jgi:hypothetical protein